MDADGKTQTENQALRRRVAELERALEQAARLKDEFLASMSHELRTPLTGILSMAEVLRDQVFGPLSPEQLDAVCTIEQSGQRLQDLINDILDLSKIELGELDVHPEACSLREIARASLDFVKGPAAEKRLQVRFEIQPEEMQIEVDVRRLKQILINLLSNAAKFTPANGRIGLRIVGDPAARRVRCTVWDTGIGIAPEGLERIFRPFVQLDASYARHYGGTGMGLSLIRRLVDLLDGTIEVESAPGQGSSFTVTLPWHPPS